jgi:hypothetical protein
MVEITGPINSVSMNNMQEVSSSDPGVPALALVQTVAKTLAEISARVENVAMALSMQGTINQLAQDPANTDWLNAEKAKLKPLLSKLNEEPANPDLQKQLSAIEDELNNRLKAK